MCRRFNPVPRHHPVISRSPARAKKPCGALLLWPFIISTHLVRHVVLPVFVGKNDGKIYQRSQCEDFANRKKLADTKLRSMKPNGKVQKESDGDWLYAYMGPKNKNISWKLGYRFENKQKVLTFGIYLEISLAEARESALKRGKCLRTDATPVRSGSLKRKQPCLPKRKRPCPRRNRTAPPRSAGKNSPPDATRH